MAKVDIGDETYDAFASLEFADVFLGGDIMRAGPWSTKDDDAKGRGLVSATRSMLQLPWKDGTPSLDDPPPVVTEVNAMLAADMVAKPSLFADASSNSNVKVAKAGSAQVEFFQAVEDAPPIPMALWTMLLNAGLVRGPIVTSDNDGPIITGISGGCRPLGGRPLDYPIAACDRD
ncbi:MAG: hypothetical protein ACJ8DZ_14105 [Allosphingosinicella sp.]